jgi:hypothetical protein
MGWSEDLLPFRAEDNFRGAALVPQDKNLLRLAATWPQVERTMPESPDSGAEVNLEEVWEKTMVNFEHWAELAQLNLLVVIEGFRALKGNRLILPDGTLNHLVDTLLQKEAAGQFMARMGLEAGDLK